MKKLLLIILLPIITFAQKPAETLNKIIKDYEDFEKKENENKPSDSLGTGILGHNSLADIERRAGYYEKIVAQLSKINLATLSQSNQINLELLKYKCQSEVDDFKYNTHLINLLNDSGFHMSYGGSMRNANPKTFANYKTYLQKLQDFPRSVTEQIELMREGIRKGITQAKVIFDGYEATYNIYIVKTPEESEFFTPFTKIPDNIDQKTKEKLIEEGKKAVMEAVRGYQLFSDFMKNEYLPAARTKEGISVLPNGANYYQMLVKNFTTLPMTVAEVHQKGLDEVARIRAEMEVVIKKTDFKGSFKEFLQFLRTDPQFYAKTPLELLKEASYISKQIDGVLPAFFDKLPRQPYGVEPVPAAIAPKYTGGRYSGASPESHRAGHYWVNTYNLPSRSLYNLEALTLHEAVPGHHLQIALNYEIPNTPKFRKNFYISAYGEGWALYCEYLGEEMGFYKSPYSKFGQLTYEMWRACRLVVDTGIHAYGWNRQQAIDYLTNNTALSIHECTTETDRYISWPGQALSYKIGELKIRELRKKAEKALGEKFNIRNFHDAVLSEGTLTLPLLEKVIDAYILKNKK
ncbi:MAG: DUF885 domain-containing protein [Bacteroidota bacterium]